MTFDIKKTGAATLLSLAVALSAAAPAQALGKRERDFLKGAAVGVAGAAIYNHLQTQPPRYRTAQPRQQYYAPAPQPQYYVQPAPTYVRQAPAAQAPRTYAPSIHSLPAAVTFKELSPHMRREVQLELARYGYYTGAIDGVWGPGTYRAVQSYARETGKYDALDTMRGSYGIYDSLSG